MRILLINNSHTIIGGADRVYINTGKLLEGYDHEVMYFSTQSHANIYSEFSKYFIKTQNLREAKFIDKFKGIKDYIYNNNAYLSLSHLIKDYKPEIAHIHLFCGGLSSSILKALKEHHVPVVQTLHDYRLLCPANALIDSGNKICEKCINRYYWQCSMKRCVNGNIFFSTVVAMEAYYRKYRIDPLNYIDHFIFVSRFSQLKHIEFDSRYSSKASHLYNFTTIPDEAIPAHKGSYFLYFGRLSREKGLNTLIEASLSANIPLKIVGTGPMYSEIRTFAANNKNIEALGHLSGDRLTNAISKASYVIVPSEWYENNPMTILEAYALGKPVIGSKIGGIPEIIEEGKTGYLFNPRDRNDLESVLLKAQALNDKEYAFLSSNARSFALSHFASDTHYKQLMQIYSQYIL